VSIRALFKTLLGTKIGKVQKKNRKTGKVQKVTTPLPRAGGGKEGRVDRQRMG